MPLVPRWRFMTDEAKALTKRTAITAGVVLFALLVLRALLPWVLLAVIGWWIWRVVSKQVCAVPVSEIQNRTGAGLLD